MSLYLAGSIIVDGQKFGCRKSLPNISSVLVINDRVIEGGRDPEPLGTWVKLLRVRVNEIIDELSHHTEKRFLEDGDIDWRIVDLPTFPEIRTDPAVPRDQIIFLHPDALRDMSRSLYNNPMLADVLADAPIRTCGMCDGLGEPACPIHGVNGIITKYGPQSFMKITGI